LAAALLAIPSINVVAQGSFDRFGSGCPGKLGSPTLNATGNHRIGGLTHLRIGNAPASTSGILIMGTSGALSKKPLDLAVLGMTGCRLYVIPSLPTVPVAMDKAGVGLVTLPIPAKKTLVGLSLYLQCAVVDTSTKTKTPLTMTNAGLLQIGDDDMSVESFHYVDKKPQNFQPLEERRSIIEQRDEILVLGSRTAAGGTIGSMHAWDDASPKNPSKFAWQSVPPSSLLGTELLTMKSGQWDGVGPQELAIVYYDNRKPIKRMYLLVMHRQKGKWVTLSQTQIGTSTAPEAIDATFADTTGDGTEEFILTRQFGTRNVIEVYDYTGSVPKRLLSRTLPGQYKFARPHRGDLDDDGRDEIVLELRNTWASSHDKYYILDDAKTTFKPIGGGIGVAPGPLAIGDFDGDTKADICFLSFKGPTAIATVEHFTHKSGLQVGFTSAQTFWTTIGNITGIGAVAAVDLDSNGVSELVFFATTTKITTGLQWHMAIGTDAQHWRGGLDGVIGIHAADVDGDGHPELIDVDIQQSTKPASARVIVQFNHLLYTKGGLAYMGSTKTLKTLVVASSTVGYNKVAHVAIGDFDGDSLELESTGKKTLRVGDPIPIALLMAPPTKAGIRQNYSATRSLYSNTSTSAKFQSVTTSVAMSTSKSAGVGFFKVFGASARRFMERKIGRTLKRTQEVSWTRVEAGGPAEHALVFQGNLYQSYEYRVVASSDPKQIGMIMTIDDPVKSKLLKWDLDTFLTSFPWMRNNFAELLYQKVTGKPDMPLVIGRPETYIPDTYLAGKLMNRYLGWRSKNSIAVGQGTGFRGVELKIGNMTGFSKSSSITVGKSSTLSAGYGVFHGSVSSGASETHSEVYGMSVKNTVSFSGRVGDISPLDYKRWDYDFGLFVLHYGVDLQGHVLPGKLPFHVIGYWTKPRGTGYGH